MVEELMREKFSRKPRMPVLNREIAPDEDPFVRLSSPPAGLEGESDDGRNIISSNESLIESEGQQVFCAADLASTRRWPPEGSRR